MNLILNSNYWWVFIETIKIMTVMKFFSLSENKNLKLTQYLEVFSWCYSSPSVSWWFFYKSETVWCWQEVETAKPHPAVPTVQAKFYKALARAVASLSDSCCCQSPYAAKPLALMLPRDWPPLRSCLMLSKALDYDAKQYRQQLLHKSCAWQGVYWLK